MGISLFITTRLKYFVKKGVTRNQYLNSSILSIAVGTSFILIILSCINFALPRIFPNLILLPNPLLPEINFILIIVLYLYGAIITFLITFALVLSWMNLNITNVWLSALFGLVFLDDILISIFENIQNSLVNFNTMWILFAIIVPLVLYWLNLMLVKYHNLNVS